MFQDQSDYFDSERDNNSKSDNQVSNFENYETIEPSDSEPEKAAQEREPAPKHRRHRFRNFMLWLMFLVLIAGAIAFYLRYYNPYAIDAHESGTIVNIEKRGILFKTYEADVATRSALYDESAQYTRQNFSFANDSLAHIAQGLQQSGQKAEITYARYFATLPWRGASVRVITDIRPCPTYHDNEEPETESSHQTMQEC